MPGRVHTADAGVTTKETRMSQNIRPANEPPRPPAVMRRGAEQGVPQVLSPAEMLALLDRLADAEAVERAAEDVVDGYAEGAVTALADVLAHRKTKPRDTTVAV